MPRLSMTARVVVLLACFVGARVLVARADRREQPPERTTFAAFPLDLGDWHGVPDPPMAQSVLDVLKADDYLTRTYYKPDRTTAGLYIGYWQTQRQGDAIHSPLNCLPGAGWEPIAQAALTLPDPRNPAATISINRYVIQKGLDRELVLYWYQSRGRVVASEYWSKAYLIADAMRFNRTDGAIVRVITPIDADAPDAADRATTVAASVVQLVLPRLDGFLPN
jgi:EpsI family protein